MAFAPTQNASLQSRSGMATPTTASWLSEVSSVEELQQALEFSEERNLSRLVLGEGSNTVFSNDYNGLVIVNRFKGIQLVEEDKASVVLNVAAGENWHELVTYCLRQNWYGLENLALIPGSVGAAPIQNIGAYGVEIADYVESASYTDMRSMQWVELNARECNFGYRQSIFKDELIDRAFIHEIKLRLHKQPKVNLSYSSLADAVNALELDKFDPTPEQVFALVCQLRDRKLPVPSAIPNCGSFFKNPIVSEIQFGRLFERYPDIVNYPVLNGVKLGRLGLSNEQVGNIESIVACKFMLIKLWSLLILNGQWG